MKGEKSDYPRFKAILNAELALPDGRTLPAQAASLSSEGANLIVAEQIPAGLHCLLTLQLKTSSPHTCYKLRADTLYSSALSELPGFGLGVRFSDPPEHYLSLLQQLEQLETPP